MAPCFYDMYPGSQRNESGPLGVFFGEVGSGEEEGERKKRPTWGYSTLAKEKTERTVTGSGSERAGMRVRRRRKLGRNGDYPDKVACSSVQSMVVWKAGFPHPPCCVLPTFLIKVGCFPRLETLSTCGSQAW